MNRRVALTTTTDRAAISSRALALEGLEPVTLPCIEVTAAEPDVLEAARLEAAIAEMLVLTSARVVELLWPCGGMPTVPVAVVGSATAGAVSRAGGVVTVVGSGGGTDLVEDLADSAKDAKVFFPHGSGADPTTMEGLRDAGATVSTHTVYETRPIAPGEDEVDAVLFGSPLAVEGWLMSRTLDDVVVGAIGATTASALRDVGSFPHVTPDEPSFERLIHLVAIELRERSTV